MKKWKRRTMAVLVFVLTVFVLTACQTVGEEKGGVTDGGDANPRVAVPSENVEHVIFTYQTLSDSSVMDEFDEVMAEINAITISEIGVEVEARQVDSRDAYTEYFLWIGNGETIDLMMLNYQDITTYVDREMLLPLDGYLSAYAPDIMDIIENEYHLEGGSVIDGKAYGVTPYSYLGSGGGIWMEGKYLREIGWEHEEKHVYTYEELTQIFAALKERYPDKYPLGQITYRSGGTTFRFYSNEQQKVGDSLGATYSSGVLAGEQTGMVVNFYATPEYQEFLQYMRKWYQAGYIYPDAAVSDYTTQALYEAGVILSWPLSSAPGIMSGVMGEDGVCLRTSRVSEGEQGPLAGFWTIPVTSKHPEAAMRFLNLMYADERIGNLLTYGIKDKHYKVVDEENKIISYPVLDEEGNVGFLNALGLYGDKHKIYWNGTLASKQAQEEYEAEAMSYRTGTEGFVYSTNEKSGEIAAIDKVVEKYRPYLESGCVDLEVYYPQFLAELSEAGIDDVIADKQAQYDAWRESRAEERP